MAISSCYTMVVLVVSSDVFEATMLEDDSAILSSSPGFDGEVVVDAEDLFPHFSAWQAGETPATYAALLTEHGDEVKTAIDEHGADISFRVTH